MNIRCSRLAQSVISYGLELFDRVEQGLPVNLDREQTIIKDLLLAEDSSDRDEGNSPSGFEGILNARPTTSKFLGIRYALVCWLDELFTVRSGWEKEWNEHKLEIELYGSNDRAWKFWEQAKVAQTRASSDAFEVYYVCVMLGFRGALTDQPEKLEAWVAAARQRLGHVIEPQWSIGGELPPVTLVPPLRGAAKLRQMALTAWVAILALAPLTAFYVVHRLAQ
ncbi:MAG TPA: DotU family type IV/VI secretion system protein [Pirellulaceae bacterium]|nr:DotU family type IV/VI secretion system protein [Pirellulaceae bacterium]